MTQIDNAAIDDPDRRIAPRTRTLKRGRIVFNNRFSTIDCVVRNVSRTGALLVIETSVQVPKQFEISMDDRDLRPARLVYRRGMLAGIHFLDAEAEETLPDLAQGHDDEGEEPSDAPLASPGIARIEHAPLPRGLSRHLPWGARR